jgi:signal transduction histidine kinase
VVSGDAEDLRTMLTNVLNNAVKYSTQECRDRVSRRAAPDTVWVRVKDLGIGYRRSS